MLYNTSLYKLKWSSENKKSYAFKQTFNFGKNSKKINFNETNWD